MRLSEIFDLQWWDVMYSEGLIAVRAKLKGGKMRYVPRFAELAGEPRRFSAWLVKVEFSRRSRRGQRAATRWTENTFSKTSGTAREIWKLMKEEKCDNANAD